MSSPPWFVEAFRADYAEVYPHRDLPAARREVAYLLECGVRGRVLDLCCGFGRHSLALRERGVDVLGLDLSFELLKRSRELLGSANLAGRLACADSRALPLRFACVDAVVLLFSSFGYATEADDQRVLAEIQRVLVARGKLVLDLMNAERTRARLVPESRTERAGLVLHERRTLTHAGQRVVKLVDLTSRSGTTRSWREDVRLYDLLEIRALLATAGFEASGLAGDFDGSAFTSESPRMILFADRVG